MNKSMYIIIILLILVGVSAFFALSTMSQKEDLEKQKEIAERSLKSAEETAGTLAQEKKEIENRLNETMRRAEILQQDLNQAKQQANKLQDQQETFKERLAEVRKERDELMVKLQEKAEPEVIVKEVPFQEQRPMPSAADYPGLSEEEMKDVYWAAVVKERAGLELRVGELESEISKYAIEIEELRKKNQEHELTINEFEEEQIELEEELVRKEKMINALSIDLAREKNDKKFIGDRYEDVKEENAKLRGQVKELASAKVTLEKSIAKLTESKKEIEQRLIETESIIQNRINEIVDIKRSIDHRLKTSPVGSQKGDEVELSPIIVSAPSRMNNLSAEKAGVTLAEPGESPGFNGQVLSINKEDNFVIVDLGVSDGVRIGDTLTVYRGNEFIANLEVIQTRNDISAADIRQKQDHIKIGDSVK